MHLDPHIQNMLQNSSNTTVKLLSQMFNWKLASDVLSFYFYMLYAGSKENGKTHFIVLDSVSAQNGDHD
jgi:hypothetical protein